MNIVFAFYRCFKNYHKPKSLDKTTVCLTDSVGQKSMHCMVEFSAQDVTGLKSRY